MEMNFGDIKAETIRGTEADSVFMVIASAKGLKLAIRPLLIPMPLPVLGSEDEYRAGLVLGARLRVVAKDPQAEVTVAAAEGAFGILGFVDKGPHVSQVIGIPLAALPCGVEEARRRWKGEGLTSVLVNTVAERLMGVGLAPSVSTFAIEAWLDQEYEDTLPETPGIDTSNTVVFGIG